MEIDIDILDMHIERQRDLAAANVGQERREAQSLLNILRQVREHIELAN